VSPAPLELDDIQGDILRAYGNAFDHTSYLFFHVEDAASGRALLSGLLDRVTSAAPWTSGKPATTLNVAITYGGVRALAVGEAVAASFSAEFRAGMAARAHVLGDAGVSDPAGWDPGLGRGMAHLLCTVNAQDADGLDAALDQLREGMRTAGGVTIVHEEHARLLEGAREHFGYADGFAQPAVEGMSDEKARGGGVPEAEGRWRPLAAGEFVLGYEDEDSRVDPEHRLPTAPATPLGRNGTYMVWRKLHQDVASFRRALAEASRLYEDGDEERLAAKVVGRWRNGTPLVRSPHAPQPGFHAGAPGANDFRYAGDDPGGRRCPIGAHIRRANPRDALGFDGRLTFRHRMIRRGMPYGPPLPDGVTEDDGRERGLVFVCFQASISRQFEGVQTQWLNDGNLFRLGDDKDFLLGDSSAAGAGKMTIEGDPPFFLAGQRAFVVTRGGEYLFVPGMAALGALAGGALSPR
jgi:Dyp-type peroxidase family